MIADAISYEVSWSLFDQRFDLQIGQWGWGKRRSIDLSAHLFLAKSNRVRDYLR